MVSGQHEENDVFVAPTRARPIWRGLIGDPLGASFAALSDAILWVPVGLGIGITAWFGMDHAAQWRDLSVACTAIVVAVIIRWKAAPQWWFPALMLALIATGVLLTEWRAQRLSAPILTYRYYGPVEGRVVKLDRSSSDRLRVTLDQLHIGDLGNDRSPHSVRISLHTEPTHLTLVPGQRVMVTAHLMPPPVPAAPRAFDFRRYAYFERLGAVGYARVPVMLVAHRSGGQWAAHLRSYLARAIVQTIPGQPGAMIAALTTGDRAGLTQATNAVLRDTNLYHVVAISGLHMGLLVGIVYGAMRFVLVLIPYIALRYPVKSIAAVTAIVAATGYLWLSGAQISTQRAYVMALVMLCAILVKRRAISLNNLAIAATLLLIITPEALIGVGFQMSFAASAALVVTFAQWARIARRLSRSVAVIGGMVLSPLVAGLATAPITAAQFHRISDYGLIANLLAVPVMGTVVMPAAVLAAVLAPLGLAFPALWVAGVGTGWMLWVANWVAGWEGATRAIVQPPQLTLPLILFGAVVLVLAPVRGRVIGIALMLWGTILWTRHSPPAVLIAPQAEQVGLLTPSGRALSKNGAGFVAGVWLEADGDRATVTQAAQRVGFSGPTGVRVARFGGRDLVHLSGRYAEQNLEPYCRDGALIVLAGTAPADAKTQCDIWDQPRLRRTGAVAITQSGKVVTTRQIQGTRRWSQ
ncbi:hypothetical protein BFP70_04495 [Thioclava sp. SK-1]|uniref:ComEC/Rec2 family competence protein n=1 Tax=Thioclava sp. SK-1 TaxID=1889770 RepID=UPI00082440DC|nr:ComEC/Rec2 family competence protein [Thioclava sp. SK-1]OCX66495.1 hypothetical protein BFP70_04495 [Thioclava sp. SK-1]